MKRMCAQGDLHRMLPNSDLSDVGAGQPNFEHAPFYFQIRIRVTPHNLSHFQHLRAIIFRPFSPTALMLPLRNVAQRPARHFAWNAFLRPAPAHRTPTTTTEEDAKAAILEKVMKSRLPSDLMLRCT